MGKAYLVCENKCFIEGVPREEIESQYYKNTKLYTKTQLDNTLHPYDVENRYAKAHESASIQKPNVVIFDGNHTRVWSNGRIEMWGKLLWETTSSFNSKTEQIMLPLMISRVDNVHVSLNNSPNTGKCEVTANLSTVKDGWYLEEPEKPTQPIFQRQTTTYKSVIINFKSDSPMTDNLKAYWYVTGYYIEGYYNSYDNDEPSD